MKLSLSITVCCIFLTTACAQQEQATQPLSAQTESIHSATPTTYQIGVMIEAISAALAKPTDPSSLETISQYGTDSRYYVMIRGWLVQELSGVQSQLDATLSAQSRADSITASDLETKQSFIDKVAFLQRAIRRIDLE